jgi:hypothetical protein
VVARKISHRKMSLPELSGKTGGGSCLCGEVAFEFERAAGRVMDCHCARCRRSQSSAVHASNIFVDVAKFRWLRGEDQVSNYGPPQDWHFASAFCRSCGGTLPRVVRSVGIVVVSAGTLDGDPGMRPTGFGFVEPGHLRPDGSYAPN